MLDLDVDSHVHSAFSTGRDSVNVLVAAAEAAGLREMTLADRAGPDSSWLPNYLATIQRAQQRTDVVLRAGVEVQAISPDGWVAFPEDLTGVEVVSVAIGVLPLPDGPADPVAVRALVDSGELQIPDVVEMLVSVTTKALDRMGRYAPTRLARPLEFLNRMEVADSEIDAAALAELADACRRTGPVVEVSERHRTPSLGPAGALAAAGVRLTAASDARQAREIGRWRYVEELAHELPGVIDALVAEAAGSDPWDRRRTDRRRAETGARGD